jgi:UPF0716 family protein affecting phage T7 exclusion
VIMIVALGHSLLAMSGFETLAQVYREVAYPKLKNLRITANIVCTYAVICTGVISLLAVMIIPTSRRASAITLVRTEQDIDSSEGKWSWPLSTPDGRNSPAPNSTGWNPCCWTSTAAGTTRAWPPPPASCRRTAPGARQD